MNKFLRSEPVITISTSAKDKCAIGIIRITGFSELGIFDDFLSIDLKKVKPRFAHFTKVKNDNHILDEGILLYYEGPNSYTGENLLELQLHGNPVSLKRIERIFADKLNLEYAFPGEFTYRAFKNKKLTLSQVEGLDLVLNSNTAVGLDQGLSVLNGNLYQNYLSLREEFLKLKGTLEILIDFSEDVGDDTAIANMTDGFNNFKTHINKLYQGTVGSVNSLISPEVALFGKTNAGKSTLFNKILSSDRAIVSSVRGTTRDYISEFFYLGDNAFRLIDTAGLRSTSDEIEEEGIQKALTLAETAFVKIYVSNPLEEQDIDWQEHIKSYDFVVFTHGDDRDFGNKISSLPVDLHKYFFKSSDSGPIEPLFSGPIEPGSDVKSGPIGPSSKNGPIEPHNFGPIGALGNSINFKYLDLYANNNISIDRHQKQISLMRERCFDVDISNDINDLGLLSMKLDLIKGSVEELVGIFSPDDVLNNIFNNFCIGK